MTAAKFLLTLPSALARDLWTWAADSLDARLCAWANVTGDDDA